jgi:hypothetical protein
MTHVRSYVPSARVCVQVCSYVQDVFFADAMILPMLLLHLSLLGRRTRGIDLRTSHNVLVARNLDRHSLSAGEGDSKGLLSKAFLLRTRLGSLADYLRKLSKIACANNP